MEPWFILLLTALAALALEFFSGTMILLALSITSALLAVLAWGTGLGLVALGGIGAIAWLVLSLALRRLFGSWGSTSAADDPNDYERGRPLGE